MGAENPNVGRNVGCGYYKMTFLSLLLQNFCGSVLLQTESDSPTFHS